MLEHDLYYHAVTDEVLEKYLKRKYIFNEYYGGFWITPDFYHARAHGNNVFRISDIMLDEEKMTETENDDGILYKSRLNIDCAKLLDFSVLNDPDVYKEVRHREYIKGNL